MVRGGIRLQDRSGGGAGPQVDIRRIAFHVDSGHMLVYPNLDLGLAVGSVGARYGHPGFAGLDSGDRPVFADRQHFFVSGLECNRRVAGIGGFCRPCQLRRLAGVYNRRLTECNLRHRLLYMNRRAGLYGSGLFVRAGDLAFTQRHTGHTPVGIHPGDILIGGSPYHILVVGILRKNSCLQHRAPAGVHGQFRFVQRNFLGVLGHLDADAGADVAAVLRRCRDSRVSAFHTGHVSVPVNRGDLFILGGPGDILHSRVFRQDGGRQADCLPHRNLFFG